MGQLDMVTKIGFHNTGLKTRTLVNQTKKMIVLFLSTPVRPQLRVRCLITPEWRMQIDGLCGQTRIRMLQDLKSTHWVGQLQKTGWCAHEERVMAEAGRRVFAWE